MYIMPLYTLPGAHHFSELEAPSPRVSSASACDAGGSAAASCQASEVGLEGAGEKEAVWRLVNYTGLQRGHP